MSELIKLRDERLKRQKEASATNVTETSVTETDITKTNNKATNVTNKPRTRNKSGKDRGSVISRHSEVSGATVPSAIPEPVKILDDAVLLDRIEKSNFNIEGEASFRNWVTRNGGSKFNNGKARTAVLTYLIRIYRQIKNEGYE